MIRIMIKIPNKMKAIRNLEKQFEKEAEVIKTNIDKDSDYEYKPKKNVTF